jgi:capsule polysaccharide modification protein KpsS
MSNKRIIELGQDFLRNIGVELDELPAEEVVDPYESMVKEYLEANGYPDIVTTKEICEFHGIEVNRSNQKLLGLHIRKSGYNKETIRRGDNRLNGFVKEGRIDPYESMVTEYLEASNYPDIFTSDEVCEFHGIEVNKSNQVKLSSYIVNSGYDKKRITLHTKYVNAYVKEKRIDPHESMVMAYLEANNYPDVVISGEICKFNNIEVNRSNRLKLSSYIIASGYTNKLMTHNGKTISAYIKTQTPTE